MAVRVHPEPESIVSDSSYKVLFICTGNTSRSILAEAIMNRMGEGRFEAFSAGSHPKGQVNPFALQVLEEWHVPTDGLRSKSWDEFAGPTAPALDFVFTVCDNAAGETCPVWPGQPMTAHWGVADPSVVTGTDDQKLRAHADAARILKRRIELMLALPIAKLERLSLRRELEAIGRVLTP